MTPEETLNVWTRHGGVWSLWTRPILFAQMPAEVAAGSTSGQVDLSSRDDGAFDPTLRGLLASEPYASGHSVLVVDLPGEKSVWVGLGLTDLGYCPVPLFNACTGPDEVVPQKQIIGALVAAGRLLADRPEKDGPPAFLLDSRRMSPSRYPIGPGDFDNRWQVFAQDLPSASFLANRRLKSVLVIQHGSRQLREDVIHVFRRWKDAGLSIEVMDLADPKPPCLAEVTRPAWYRSPWQRLLATFRLRRNPKGGFGQEVPKPSSHG